MEQLQQERQQTEAQIEQLTDERTRLVAAHDQKIAQIDRDIERLRGSRLML